MTESVSTSNNNSSVNHNSVTSSGRFGVWEGLRFVIVALPGLFAYLFFFFFFFFFATISSTKSCDLG